MNKRRRYDLKNKRGLIIILIVSIVIIGVFSLFIYRYSKTSKILYVIEAGSIIQDINNNYLNIDDDIELKIRWNGNYYGIYNDKNVNFGKKVITFNTITEVMKLYGEFYEIKKDGKIVEFRNETTVSSTKMPRFYKIADRKYLVIDSKITSEDRSIEANEYLLVELDKVGNAKLSNNKINLKTISPTKLVTSEYVFDIANEIIKFGEYTVDLKKIIGSTNQYVPEDEESSKKPNDDPSSGGTGTGNGTGSGGGSGSGSSGGNVTTNKGEIIPSEELLNKVKMTSVIRVVEGIDQIDVDYVIYDPFNEYTSVYAEIIHPDKVQIEYLSKNETHLTIGGTEDKKLDANTDYKINFVYTTRFVDPVSGAAEDIPYVFDSFELKTKLPEYDISVYKLSRVDNTLSYKINLQDDFPISKINVHMEFDTGKKDDDGNPIIAPFDDSIDIPSANIKYITDNFDISEYIINPNTIINLTVKSVVSNGKELPINSSYTFRFGGSDEKTS